MSEQETQTHDLEISLRQRIANGEFIYNHWQDHFYSRITFQDVMESEAQILSRWFQDEQLTLGDGYQVVFAHEDQS